MSEAYTIVPSLTDAVEATEGAILSKPIFSDTRLRATLFALGQGQELTEHTTTMEAVVQILEGEVEFRLGEDLHVLRAGAWIQMNPNLAHSLRALTPVKMLLLVLRDKREA